MAKGPDGTTSRVHPLFEKGLPKYPPLLTSEVRAYPWSFWNTTRAKDGCSSFFEAVAEAVDSDSGISS